MSDYYSNEDCHRDHPLTDSQLDRLRRMDGHDDRELQRLAIAAVREITRRRSRD